MIGLGKMGANMTERSLMGGHAATPEPGQSGQPGTETDTPVPDRVLAPVDDVPRLQQHGPRILAARPGPRFALVLSGGPTAQAVLRGPRHHGRHRLEPGGHLYR